MKIKENFMPYTFAGGGLFGFIDGVTTGTPLGLVLAPVIAARTYTYSKSTGLENKDVLSNTSIFASNFGCGYAATYVLGSIIRSYR